MKKAEAIKLMKAAHSTDKSMVARALRGTFRYGACQYIQAHQNMQSLAIAKAVVKEISKGNIAKQKCFAIVKGDYTKAIQRVNTIKGQCKDYKMTIAKAKAQRTRAGKKLPALFINQLI